jgi:hypothetical protein
MAAALVAAVIVALLLWRSDQEGGCRLRLVVQSRGHSKKNNRWVRVDRPSFVRNCLRVSERAIN